jgi:predicted nicotinamide N-methyase
MPVQIASTNVEDHPLAELTYVIETAPWRVAGETLQLTTLKNVESSIDQVIDWLEVKGYAPEQIENLAPYFGVVWPSSLALCAYLDQGDVKRRILGRSVVELGCGLGLPAMICSRAGGKCVVVDSHPSVPSFLRLNVSQNEPLNLIFESPEDLVAECKTTGRVFDWVIASDVLYDRSMAAGFAEVISVIASSDATCVVTDPGRAYVNEFVSAMQARGWAEDFVIWSVPAGFSSAGKETDVFVMVFRRKKSRDKVTDNF